MRHLGDFDLSTVVYGKFTTFRPSTGAAFTLGGSPVISVYKDGSLTQTTTGATLTADFDGVAGLNHFAIDTSTDGSFYAAGSFFQVVITTGTVDSISVVGSVVGSFTLLKASALRPTTAGRTLDVAATGEAGLDFDNIKQASGATTLTNIRVPNVTLTDTVTTYTGNTPQTGDSFARIGAAGAGLTALGDTRIANLDVTVSSRLAPAGTLAVCTLVTTATNLTNAPTSGDFTAAMKTSLNAATPAVTVSDKTGFSLSGTQTFNNTGNLTGNVSGSVGSVTGNVGGNVTGSVGSVVGAAGSVTGAVGSVTGNVGGNVVGSVGSVVGAVGSVTGLTASNLDATVSSRLATSGYTAPDNADIVLIKAKTDNLPASPSSVGSAMTLTSGERTTLADLILGEALSAESYAADGAVPTLSQALYMILSEIGQFSISGTTLTCQKLDGTTTSMTFTLDSATAPTSRTRAT